MKNIILKLLNVIYILFLIYLIIINFYKFNYNNLIGLIISLLIIIIFKNKKINKKTFILLIITSVIIRISLLFLNYTNILGDYNFNYISSLSYANNIKLDNGYISLFPYLYSYIFVLGNIFKLFSTKYIYVIILNYLFEIIGLIFLIKYINIKNKDKTKYGILIYLLNPFNIIWNTFASPLIIVNTLFLICIYLLTYINREKKIYKNIILCILLGIMLSLFNSFRPIAIILIISTIMYIVLNSIKNRIFLKKNLFKIILALLTFVSINTLTSKFISKNINLEVAKTKSGWSIMLGSNYKYSGAWNSEDTEKFKNMQINSSADEAQKKALKYGINRYKTNKIKNIILFIKKSIKLGNDFDNYTLTEFSNQINLNKYIKILIKIFLTTYLYVIIILNINLNIKIKNNNDFIIPIYAFGLFVSTLLVEVSPRYFYPILFALILNLVKKEDKNE